MRCHQERPSQQNPRGKVPTAAPRHEFSCQRSRGVPPGVPSQAVGTARRQHNVQPFHPPSQGLANALTAGNTMRAVPRKHTMPKHGEQPWTSVPATQCYWAPCRVAPPWASHGGCGRPALPEGSHPPGAGALAATPAKAVCDDLPARACFPGTPPDREHPVAQVPVLMPSND